MSGETVTLWQVRRPDGTVIGCQLGTYDEQGFENAAWVDEGLNKVCGGLLASGRKWDLAEKAGYVLEPIVFAPLPSAETRASVKVALETVSEDRAFAAIAHPFRAALAELTAKGWGE